MPWACRSRWPGGSRFGLPQTEESRARPSGAGNKPRNRGQVSKLPPFVGVAVFLDIDAIGNPAPLAHQQGSRHEAPGRFARLLCFARTPQLPELAPGLR